MVWPFHGLSLPSGKEGEAELIPQQLLVLLGLQRDQAGATCLMSGKQNYHTLIYCFLLEMLKSKIRSG